MTIGRIRPVPHPADHFWINTSKHAYDAAPSAARTIVRPTRACAWPRSIFSSATAMVLKPAAVQRRAPIESPINTVLNNATSRILIPSTGVATETSPVFSASRLKICPAKNIVAATGGCHHKEEDGIVPPRSHNGTATIAVV